MLTTAFPNCLGELAAAPGTMKPEAPLRGRQNSSIARWTYGARFLQAALPHCDFYGGYYDGLMGWSFRGWDGEGDVLRRCLLYRRPSQLLRVKQWRG